MKTNRLLHCLGDLDDELILEADTRCFRPNPWPLRGVLAACLALILVLPVLLPQGDPESAAPGALPTESEALSDPPMEPERPSVPQTDSISPVPGESPEERMARAPEILKTERVGELYLGLEAEALKDLLGLPVPDAGQTPVAYADGSLRTTWFYRIAGDTGFDLQLSLANVGNGWFVNEISLFPPNPMKLSTGIGLGTPVEEVALAYPQALHTQATVTEQGQARQEDYFLVGEAQAGLRITCREGVTAISLGPLLPYPLEGAMPEE